MGTRQVTWVVLAATGAVLLSAAGASAALPVYNKQSNSIAANQSDEAFAPCPGKPDPIGGGAFITGSSLEVEVKSSAPSDGLSDGNKTPDDYWYAAGNAGPSQEELTSTAICSRLPVRYAGAKTKVGAGSDKSKTSECPDGLKVISGGVDVSEDGSTSVRLAASVPVRGQRWKGRLLNASAAQQRMTVWAICADVRTRRQVASSSTPTLLNNTQGSLSTTSCSSARFKVTGVGAEVIGTPPGTEVASLVPTDLDAGTDPDDGALAWFNNQSGSAQRMRVTAICTKF